MEREHFVEGTTTSLLFKVSISGQRSPRSIDIGKNSCVLGRGKECDIVINEDLISRKHLKISMEDNALYIEEMGSSNGSWINSHKLIIGKKMAYKNGDVIHLGKASSALSITIENLCVQKAAASSEDEKTLVFTVGLPVVQKAEETSTRLVANGALVVSTSPTPLKPSMKIVEPNRDMEDKIREMALKESAEIIKNAHVKEQEILDIAHHIAKSIAK